MLRTAAMLILMIKKGSADAAVNTIQWSVKWLPLLIVLGFAIIYIVKPPLHYLGGLVLMYTLFLPFLSQIGREDR